MMMSRAMLPAVLLGGALLGASPGTAAQTANPVAIQLFEDGRKLMAEGKAAEACPKFAESQRLTAAVGTLLNLAKCYEALGKTTAAWTRYKSALYLAKKLNDNRMGLAEQRALELEPTLMKLDLRVTAEVPGLILRIDGEELPKEMFPAKINIDPGPHVIEATAPGYEIWQTKVTLHAGSAPRELIVPALIAQPGKPKDVTPGSWWSPRRIAGTAVGGVGAAGVLAGAVAGALTGHKVTDAKAAGCNADMSACSPAGLDIHQQAEAMANVSNVAFAVGGAALITGVVLMVTAPRSAPAPTSARWMLGPVANRDITGVAMHGVW